jgi:hypothetical protein
MMLRVCSLLDGSAQPLADDFTGRGRLAGRISRGLGRAPGVELVPGAKEYADWFLLANLRHYFKSALMVARERAFLRTCYALCANLEADLALARHLQSTPTCAGCSAVRRA